MVAIKILHPHYSTEQELVERFRREARAASRIGHPNIIDVMDFGTTEDGCAYFIMEHLDGIDLADVLSHERRLDPERSCQITIQICRALAAAHAAGVIHRDLKPENIFLVARDGEGRLRQGARLRRRAQRRAHDRASPTRASRWGRRSTWRPSRPPAASSITAATSIRSARCSTR